MINILPKVLIQKSFNCQASPVKRQEPGALLVVHKLDPGVHDVDGCVGVTVAEDSFARGMHQTPGPHIAQGIHRGLVEDVHTLEAGLQSDRGLVTVHSQAGVEDGHTVHAHWAGGLQILNLLLGRQGQAFWTW